MEPQKYELTFQHNGSGTATAENDVVVVHRTDATGPGGHPVYSDDTGIVLAEISNHGEVRMLASGSQQALERPITARPLPQ